MILGMGCDVVNIARIQEALDKFGKKFLERTYSETEIKNASRFSDEVAYVRFLARRFAAKEAFVKALGTGFRAGVRFRDITVVNDTKGKPKVVLSGKVKTIVSRMGKEVSILVSLSDDHPVAMAMVVIECQAAAPAAAVKFSGFLKNI